MGALCGNSIGDDEVYGYGFGIVSEILETSFIVGLTYATSEFDEIDNTDIGALDMKSKDYGLFLSYAYSVSPDFDIVPSIGYAKSNLDFVGQEIMELSSYIVGVEGRYKVSENSIFSFGVDFTDSSVEDTKILSASTIARLGGSAAAAQFTDALENDSGSDWEESFSLGYEHGLTDNLILDLSISTFEFDTYNYTAGLSWSWGS
ncbi:MAG: Uncharacterised protein [Opitutia bacterium UBA7350]|nr:MAG: Uncharacterised protein [Opitutae bacterium UBA7350]